jgi:hypothetical protein
MRNFFVAALLALTTLVSFASQYPDPARQYPRFSIGVTGINATIEPGLVVTVAATDAGTSCDGKLKGGDKIVAINGKPISGPDPRVILGNAITAAESSDGRLTLSVIRDNNRLEVPLTLPVLGAYAPAWPANCKKSEAIMFFFALYEARKYEPVNTDNAGASFFEGKSDEGFWGAKIDWQISDKHLLEVLAFSDENRTLSDRYNFDLASGERGVYTGTTYSDNGGVNWAATYTGYLTEGLSMKVLYGENERGSTAGSPNDADCNRVLDARGTSVNVGCTGTTQVLDRTDTREAARIDFEWALGDHQLRFGLDHETNTSDHVQYYPGPDRLLYEVFRVGASGATVNGVPLAANTEYVRTRQNEVFGAFETINSAYYLEDNWSVTDNFVLNLGVRLEAFDNKTAEGDSYIKIDDMLAPRLGFSWDMKGDGRMKLFGNAGRYFLPVANVINIKQAGAFLDERTFYLFNGFQPFEYNGVTYQQPILGAQFGPVDNSQGDGTVGDFRGEVDADMDPVYQDELILGFQSMIGEKWSYGVRGIYRNLENAIDDMRILSTGIVCAGRPNRAGFVMGNPGDPLSIFSDTDCNGAGGTRGDAHGAVTVDVATDGCADLPGPTGRGP